MKDSSSKRTYLCATEFTRIDLFTFYAVVTSDLFAGRTGNPIGEAEVFNFFKASVITFVFFQKLFVGKSVLHIFTITYYLRDVKG